MEKRYTAVGITSKNGNTKIRYANDMVNRIKVFSKLGHEVDFFELPQPMTKIEALQYLQTQQLKGDGGYVVAQKLADKTKAAKAGEVKVQAQAPKAKAKTTAKTAELA